MNGDGLQVPSLSAAVMEAVFDGTASAVILCDKNDHIAFVGRQITNFFPIPQELMETGVRLRDFLGAVYDSRPVSEWHMENGSPAVNRAEWVAERVALHWRERSEAEENIGNGRWIRWTKRRLPNGYGVSVIVDVSEHHNREEQWRVDMERVQLIEEILDSFPFPLCVKDKDLLYVAANRAFCRLQGQTGENLIGRSVFEFVSRNHAEIIEAADRYVMDSGSVHCQHQRLLSAEGLELPVLARKFRVGKPGRYFLVTVLEDLSEFLMPDGSARNGAFDAGDDWLSIDNSGLGLQADNGQTTIAGPDHYHLMGKKVLLVGCDERQKSVVQQLAAMGTDACCIDTLGELELFLDMATSSGVRIDIIAVNSEFGIEYLEMADQYGVRVIGCDPVQFDTNLPFFLARELCLDKGESGIDADEGDWEISTDTGMDGLQVLVVEDNEVNRIVFRHILEGIGCRHMLAGDGHEAVALWNEFKPSVILMDISLPGMDGFDACKQIRALEAEGDIRTPIIGVLSHVSDINEKKCLDAEMDGSICKPLSPAMLADLLAQYIPRSGFAKTVRAI